MAHFQMTMIISEEGEGGRGIDSDNILFFCMDKKPYWVRKKFQSKKAKNTGDEAGNELKHIPDSNELAYVITDALLRYKPDISASYGRIKDLFAKIEDSSGLTMEEYFHKYRGMKHHKESRRILSLLREELENSQIKSKIAIQVLVDGPIQAVTENMLRMNAPFELCLPAKYRLKGENGIEESL